MEQITPPVEAISIRKDTMLSLQRSPIRLPAAIVLLGCAALVSLSTYCKSQTTLHANVLRTPCAPSDAACVTLAIDPRIEDPALPASEAGPIQTVDSTLSVDSNGLVHGIDISSYAKDIEAGTWQQMKADGWSFVIVSAWQGRRQNPYALQQLQSARQAGLNTAAYCLLNFDHAQQTGDWQVKRALEAVGPEPLTFLAIDVEVPNASFKITVNGIKRIQEAVRMVQRAGLQPVIYTQGPDWKRITKDLRHPKGTQLFKTIPLWGLRWDEDDNLARDHFTDWKTYGGWDHRVGKQYADNTGFLAQMIQLRYRIPSLDLNVFDEALFAKPAAVAQIPVPDPAPSAPLNRKQADSAADPQAARQPLCF
jgi:GH25 family lysozyme M1 (1,4-beta-N-acetylmuramidase)